MSEPSDEKLIELLLAQRDGHVRRLHAFNRNLGMLVLAVSLAVFLGAILGIDALADVDLESTAAQLIRLAKWAFGASAALLALAAIHQTGDRGTAAGQLEGAVTRLMAGEPRDVVLADLGKAMAPLLPHPRSAQPGQVLAAELNSRWLALSLHEKTFFGLALLLVAALLVAVGMVGAYSPLDADDAGSDFEAALQRAHENALTSAGAKYDKDFGRSFSEKLQANLKACSQGGLERDDLGTFDVVARVADSGRLQKILVEPSTKFSECVRAAVADTEFPVPPEPRHWVNVHVSFSE